jgi:hypothetical protein
MKSFGTNKSYNFMVYIHIIFRETKFTYVLFQIFHSHDYEHSAKSKTIEYQVSYSSIKVWRTKRF